jgi:hypothetical protein
MTDTGDWYDLDGNPIDADEYWLMWQQERHIARTQIGDVEVSTVWLGLNHRFLGDGAPLIFETMIFGGPHDQWQWRYPTREAALAGHDQAVALVRDPAPRPR